MKIPIQINETTHNASIVYVTKSDFLFLEQWKRSLGGDKNPNRVDALEFASLACKRFRLQSRTDIYAFQLDDISDHVQNNPRCEVANLVTLQCPHFPPSPVLGVVHFRRTWDNNLVLDYLAVHPWIGKPPEDFPVNVRGVGTALLYFVSIIGRKNACKSIWGEATQNSCSFYQKVFNLQPLSDLLYIPREKFVKYADDLEQTWSTKCDQNI